MKIVGCVQHHRKPQRRAKILGIELVRFLKTLQRRLFVPKEVVDIAQAEQQSGGI